MAWYEITVKTSIMCIDAVSSIFYSLGANGVQIVNPKDPDMLGNASGLWDFFAPENTELDFEGATVTGYLDLESIDDTLMTLKEKVNGLVEFDLDPSPAVVDFKSVNPSEWESEWKKYFKPFRLGSHMVVKPTWETFLVEEGDIVIEIDPGNAFGSGTHETTSLCIEMIEKVMNQNDSVIDVGCGSGILSIAAGLLGAQSVIGVDIDPVAVKTARENIKHNHLDRITEIRQGDLLSVVETKADLVVANIIAEVIVILINDIHKVLKPGGKFIASGIINTRTQWVLEHYSKDAFKDIEIIEKGEWCAIIATKI